MDDWFPALAGPCSLLPHAAAFGLLQDRIAREEGDEISHVVVGWGRGSRRRAARSCIEAAKIGEEAVLRDRFAFTFARTEGVDVVDDLQSVVRRDDVISIHIEVGRSE